MRIFKILAWLVLAIICLLAAVFFYLKSTAPTYEGQQTLTGLEQEVEVYFDDYGIPHIYAQNGMDAYFSLGYLHARERLFQMELIKRLVAGRLSEFLGDVTLETDKYFRTLDLQGAIEQSYAESLKQKDEDFFQFAAAYVKGVNHFIDNGDTPIEFTMLGIEKESFTQKDIYNVYYYMALGFTLAVKEEPLVSAIHSKLGDAYTDVFDFGFRPDTSLQYQDAVSELTDLDLPDNETLLASLGIPIWEGSNAWLIAPERSKSGKALFANDTHIGFSQPSVWFEAHLEYPGFSFYGNYLAGSPFGIIGHNKELAWGLTIFPLDNMDLYQEKINPENTNEVWRDSSWVSMEVRSEVINIKDKESVPFEVKSTSIGPIMNEVVPLLKEHQDAPVSLWWTIHKIPTKFLQAAYTLNYARDINDARKGASMIDILGLNVMYADHEGNIAWWGSGKIPKRRGKVISKVILDATNPDHQVLGFHAFEENPHEVNPESGVIASCNHMPGPTDEGLQIQGYYLPNTRINRLHKLLSSQEKWSLEEFKEIHADITNEEYARRAHMIAQMINPENTDKEIIDLLMLWDGSFDKKSKAPLVYSAVIYEILKTAMEDELSEELFSKFVTSFLGEKSFSNFFNLDNNPWWDDISTPEKETKKAIIQIGFKKAIGTLKEKYGSWSALPEWGSVHQLTHVHAIGRKKPFDRIFNVGPFPAPGGSAVLNKLDYRLGNDLQFPVPSGPALRILIDFNDVNGSESINPTGQSGHFLSPHYDDQASMYVDGSYRGQLMDKSEIQSKGTLLKLHPQGK